MEQPTEIPVIETRTVMKMVDEMENFKKKDSKARDLNNRRWVLEEQKDSIYRLIQGQNYENDDELAQLRLRISKIAEDIRKLELALKELLHAKFGHYEDKVGNLYNTLSEIALRREGIDRDLVKSQLKFYEALRKGNNYNQTMNDNMKYAQKKFKLPEDFFNPLPDE